MQMAGLLTLAFPCACLLLKVEWWEISSSSGGQSTGLPVTLTTKTYTIKSSKMVVFGRGWVHADDGFTDPHLSLDRQPLSYCRSRMTSCLIRSASYAYILWTSIRSAETPPHLTFLLNRMQKTVGGKTEPYQEIEVTVITAQVQNSGLTGPQLLEGAVRGWAAPV